MHWNAAFLGYQIKHNHVHPTESLHTACRQKIFMRKRWENHATTAVA